MSMKRGGHQQWSLCFGVCAILSFCGAKVALAQSPVERTAHEDSSQRAVSIPSASTTSPPSATTSSAGLTQGDLDELAAESFVTVAGPTDAMPEELVQTILEAPDLPAHIREPFVRLAQAKAPHLLRDWGMPTTTAAGRSRPTDPDGGSDSSAAPTTGP